MTQAEVESPTQDGSEGNLFDRMHEDSYILVSRMDDTTKRWVYLGRLHPSEAFEEVVAEKGGGGRYRLQEKAPDASGRMVYTRQRSLDLGGPVIPSAETKFTQREPVKGDGTFKPGPGSPVGAATVAGPAGVGISDVMTAGILQLLQGQKTVTEMQAQAFQMAMTRPTTDWSAVVAAATPIVVELLKNRQQQADPIALVAQLAEIMKQNTAQSSPLKDTVGVLNELWELKENMTGSGENEGGIADMAAKQLPRLIDLAQAEQQRKPVQTPAAPALPQQTAVPQGGTEVWQRMLQGAKAQLLKLAGAGVQPEASAELILKLMPAPIVNGPLKTFMAREDAPTLLFQAIPELGNYQEWAEETFTIIGEMLFPEEEPDDEEELETVEAQPGTTVPYTRPGLENAKQMDFTEETVEEVEEE